MTLHSQPLLYFIQYMSGIFSVTNIPRRCKVYGLGFYWGGVRLFLLLLGLCVCVCFVYCWYVCSCVQVQRPEKMWWGEGLALLCSALFPGDGISYRIQAGIRKIWVILLSVPTPCWWDQKSTWPFPVFFFLMSFRIQTHIFLLAQWALTHWASLQPFSLILN